MDEIEAPLKWTQRLWYGLPAFSTTSLTITIALYANDFYGVNCTLVVYCNAIFVSTISVSIECAPLELFEMQ